MTPQPPNASPSWFSQNWKWVAGIGCAGLVLCCGGSGLLLTVGALAKGVETTPDGTLERARVDCGAPGLGGVDCEVTRTAGTRAVSVCWALEITCQNGGVMTGRGCGALADQQERTSVNLPEAAFSNQEHCDVPARGAVKDLVVTLE